MGYNTRQLKASPDPKEPAKPKDVIVDPEGQWKFPGQITKIPGNYITMQGVPYPVLGVDNSGNKQMMMPDMEYHFPGAESVTEYPQLDQAKKGGVRKFPRVHDWRSTGDQSRMQFQEGGSWLDQYQEEPKNNIQLNDGFRTWDLGKYEGQEENSYMKKIIQEHRDNPDKPVPGGETYREFLNRIKPAYNQALASLPDKSLILTHSEVVRGLDLPKLQPGKIHEIPVGDKTIYVGRHGDTDQNNTTSGPTLVRTKNAELAPKGIKEAEKTASTLADKGVTNIVSSTLPRAITTSNIIANTIKEKLGGQVDNEHSEFRKGGSPIVALKRGHSEKNIQSSINKLFTRNHALFGNSIKGIYEPYIDKKELGGANNGWLDKYQE